MFIKSTLAKFEWSGQPKELPDLYIENLLLNSNTYNFAVVNVKGLAKPEANGEFWGYFSVLRHEPKYKMPAEIIAMLGDGSTYTTTDFVLFNNFKPHGTLNSNYINYYSQMIRQINKAISQHITASQLVATIYASSKAELDSLKKAFAHYDGVKVIEYGKNNVLEARKTDFVQFEIEPRLTELEDLKHEIERDLFLRLGITIGTDKTHITTKSILDRGEPADLVNIYEYKLRKDFCARYNAWKGEDILSVSMQQITKDNTLHDSTESEEGASNDNDNV